MSGSEADPVVVALDGTVLTVAQPRLQRDLGASFTEVQWTSTAYLVAVAGLLVFAGRLGDRYGQRRVFALGLDAYTARNEYLISALRGHDLTAVRSRSDQEHPLGSWDPKAFASGFTFDLDDEGRFLAERLDRIEGLGSLSGQRG